MHHEVREEDVLSYLLYPQVYLDYASTYGSSATPACCPRRRFSTGCAAGDEISVEIEAGKTLVVQYMTTSDLHEDGTRTVYFELNGQPRSCASRTSRPRDTCTSIPRPTTEDPNHVAAPDARQGLHGQRQTGRDLSRKGQPLLSVEAMKMEIAVYAPREAKVADVLVDAGQRDRYRRFAGGSGVGQVATAASAGDAEAPDATHDGIRPCAWPSTRRVRST